MSSSWSNRFGAWSGRFSPFGRGDSANKEVSDADFSYITTEDLVASQKNLGAAPNSNSSSTDDLDATNNHEPTRRASNRAPSGQHQHHPPGRDNANGDTDVIVFKHKRVSYPIHFPRGSIDADSLTIFGMREAAARKMGIDDARRIKLFYKGRQLEDDRPAAAYGLRSDLESEVMCVVGEKPSSSRHPAEHTRSSNSYSDDEASSGEDSYRSSTPGGGDAPAAGKRGGKKRNRRGGRKNNKGPRADVPPTSSQPPSSYVRGAAGAEYLGVPPSTALPPRPTSSSSTSRPSPSPHRAAAGANTPMDQLASLSHKYRTELEPQCSAFIAAPPADRAKRDFEYKRLTETVLAQIVLKLDAVDTSGDEGARARRKELVRECNDMLGRLDTVGKPGKA